MNKPPPHLRRAARRLRLFALFATALVELLILFAAWVTLNGNAASFPALQIDTGELAPVPGAIALLLFGLLVGLANGLLVVATGASPFLITLGTATLVYALSLITTQSKTLYATIPAFNVLGRGQLFGVLHYSVMLFLGLALGLEFVLRRTVLGRTLYVIGLNETAGRLSGLRVGAVKLAAFTLKHTVSPNAAMSTPPIDGPTSRVPFISMELSAIALGRSSRLSSICRKIDWRVEISNALQTPPTRTRASRSGTVMRSSPVSSASASDCSAMSVSTVMRSLRRFTRSPITPAKGEKTRCGAPMSRPTRPVYTVEPVIR